MVSRTSKGGVGATLTIIAILLVSMIPLTLDPPKIALPDISANNVYTDNSVVKQGEPVTIYLSDYILSESVGILYFVFDFHDQTGIYYIDRLNDPETSVTHTYEKVGQYDVSVVALRGNLSRVFSVPITVIPDTLDIQIKANISNPVENQVIGFSASLTDNLFATPLSYIWEFGDGSSEITDNSDITYQYDNKGDYIVKLKVYSNESIIYTDYYDITVKNTIPNIEIKTSNSVAEDKLQTFTAVVDESISDLSTLVYIWDFDDGTYGTGPVIDHRYYLDGTYNVKLHVIDDDGAQGLATVDIAVKNQIPMVTLSSVKLAYYEGETAITTASIEDSQFDLQSIDYQWSVEADGRQASIPMLDDGLFRFGLNVTDNDGAQGYAETDLINIVNIAPVVSLINAYTEYNITFRLYGTLGTEINMTLFDNNQPIMNTSLTSYSLINTQSNTTTFYNIRQVLQNYTDILYYVNNKTGNYDNYLETEFSFENAANISIINRCQSGKPCSPISWRTPIAPLDRGFPVNMEFEYFDPGNDNITVGIDFGTNSVSSFQQSNGTSNYGRVTLSSQFPYAQNPNNMLYWAEDDDGGRNEYRIPLLNYKTVARPDGYLNITAWERSGNTISHYAPGAFIGLDAGGYNISTWDDELLEGERRTFRADPAYYIPQALTYEWHFGDGSLIVKTRNPVHSYEYSGRYLVWVLITDGIYSSVSYQWIDVVNQPQDIEPIIIGNFIEGEQLSYSVSGLISDLQMTSTYQFIWDFGDGRLEYGMQVNHIYQSAGNYSFSLTYIDEHLDQNVIEFILPIFSAAPYVLEAVKNNYEITEGDTLSLYSYVKDSAFDNLDLQYRWMIDNEIYTEKSLQLKLITGNYSGTFSATDNDGEIFSYQFNVTVVAPIIDLSMNDFVVNGRTIDKNVEIFGTISPSILSYLNFKNLYDIDFTLLGKKGTVLYKAKGEFYDNYQFSAIISLNDIFNNETLRSMQSDIDNILDIIGSSKGAISGTYRIIIDASLNNKLVSSLDGKLKLTADQDGDILTDEMEVLLSNIDPDITLDPLKEDTDDNGITDTVEFLIADDDDGDGLPSILENEWGSDPNDADTDDDGLEDGYGKNGLGELVYGSSPIDADTDGDGLNDYQEAVGWDIIVTHRTYAKRQLRVTSDPLQNDTDNDRVNDYFEMQLGINPQNYDTDGDYLSDIEEKNRGTYPNRYDSDFDGIDDYSEVYISGRAGYYDIDRKYVSIFYFTDPLNPDSDGDGLSDGLERRIGSSATNIDTDQDFLNDSIEYYSRVSNIRYTDTDGDKLVDGAEVFGFEIPQITIIGGEYDEDGNVLKSPSRIEKTIIVKTLPNVADTDGDGLTDYEELMSKSTSISNPTLVDSDNDGLSDLIDPYPLISDFAPPSFAVNINGEQGISLLYKVGDNSIVANVKKALTATLSTIWGLMKDATSLVGNIISSIFYWKCVARVFGKCVTKVPKISSSGTISRKIKSAIQSFITSSEARLRQLFSGYANIANSVSKSFNFANFGFGLKKSKIGIPIGITVSGVLNMLVTTATKVVQSLIDPSVNVKFRVIDDNRINKIEVFQDGIKIKTINVNAKTYNFNEDFSILTQGGSTSTRFIFKIYDNAGNVKIITRSDSVLNFINKIANQVVKSVKSVIDTIATWAKNIADVAITAVVNAAEAVIDAAVAIYEAIKDFVLNSIPALFKSFVIDTVGKYLSQKFNDAQSLIDLLSSNYQSSRSGIVGAIDKGIQDIGIVDTVNDTLYNVENFISQYVPSLDPDEILGKISGGVDFLDVPLLEGTIVEYVITFMKDGFIKLLQNILTEMMKKIAESIFAQYLKPLTDIFDQLKGVYEIMNIDMAPGKSFGLGSTSLGGISQVVSLALSLIKVIQKPAETLSPLLDKITGENIMKLTDIFFIDNPNLLISVFDIVKSILTPVVMYGLVLGDIITSIGSLFSSLSIETKDNSVNILGIPYDINNYKLSTSKLNALKTAQTLSFVRVLWKMLEIVLDLSLNLFMSKDREDDGEIEYEIAAVDFVVKALLFEVNFIFDVNLDIARGDDPATSGLLNDKLFNYIFKAVGIVLKGIFLITTWKFRGTENAFFNMKMYDLFGVFVIETAMIVAEFITAIATFAALKADDKISAANDWIFAIKFVGYVLDLIFQLANFASNFGEEISDIKFKTIYRAVYVAKGFIKISADIVDMVAGW